VRKHNVYKIEVGRKIYWLTPGWMKYKQYVYQGWDKGLANENSPNTLAEPLCWMLSDKPEGILEFSDWMGIPIEPYVVSFGRLKGSLMEAIKRA